MYELTKGHGEIIITKKEKRGSYIVCRMFDDDKKAERIAKEIVKRMNNVSISFNEGYEKGWSEATSEACKEIAKNYQPNKR